MRNIVLIGMPGAGKSTIGVLLAKALGMRFADTDLAIQEGQGMLLQEIIDRRGIGAFLEIEEETILSQRFENTVVAPGGSAVYSPRTMAHLKANGVVVYLKLTGEEIAGRVGNIRSRGIVLEKGQSLSDIFKTRAPLYERYADYTVGCSGKTAEEIVGLISDLPL